MLAQTFWKTQMLVGLCAFKFILNSQTTFYSSTVWLL